MAPTLFPPLPAAVRDGCGVALAAAAALASARVLRLARDLGFARGLARSPRLFVPAVRGTHATRRALIAGDSTGVGTGVAHPAHSLAGLVAAAFPHTAIANRARVGARWRHVAAQIEGAAGTFDAVLILAGGNDVLRLERPGTIAAAARHAIAAARVRAPTVIVAGPANVGLAPFFFWPLRRLLSRRTRAVADAVKQACSDAGAHYVDFFHEAGADRFSRDSARYYAADGLHPSAASHRYCFEAILARTPLAAALAERGGVRK